MGEVGREGGDDVGRRWRGDQHVGEERLPGYPIIIINKEGEVQGGDRKGERVGGEGRGGRGVGGREREGREREGRGERGVLCNSNRMEAGCRLVRGGCSDELSCN